MQASSQHASRQKGFFKPFSLILFVVVMVWVFSIMIADSPKTRIDKVCIPVSIGDRLFTATAAIMSESFGRTTHTLITKADYSCRLIIWKTFYDKGAPDVLPNVSADNKPLDNSKDRGTIPNNSSTPANANARTDENKVYKRTFSSQ